MSRDTRNLKLIIAYNGVRLFRTAWKEVLDVSPPQEVIDRIRTMSGEVMGVVLIECAGTPSLASVALSDR